MEEEKFDHKKILETIPENPGCYLMKDKDNKIVYIGKAKNLKKRVKNYFQKSGDNRAFIKFLGDILSDIEVTITPTEEEALLLEATLIRIHRPKYNIIYKDNKYELIIKLDLTQKYPYLQLVREYKKDNALYLGPFFDATKVRGFVSTLNRVFKLRTCSDSTLKTTKRACLEFEINRCSAPCVNEITDIEYAKSVKKLKGFLKGKGKALLKELENEMYRASENLLFEKAATFRDQIKMLKYHKTLFFHNIDYKKNIDIIGYSVRGDSLAIAIMILRNGLIIDKKVDIFNELKFLDFIPKEIILSIITQYYSQKNIFPEEVAITDSDFDLSILTNYFKTQRDIDINFFFPKNEKILKLVNMANDNARLTLEKEFYLKNKNNQLLKSIKKRFQLLNLPKKIECYDNSNIQGTNPVASKVEFRDTMPYKKGYKHYKIKTVFIQNDYAYMKEVITRRVTRGIKENQLPDLIIVDGGKGQLNATYKVLVELKVEDKIDLLSIAKIKSQDDKKDQYYERIFKVGASEPIILKQNSPELVVFVKLRDEAHRFAIEFHRKLRTKSKIQSVLNSIEGIGSKRKQILLKHFKSISKIKEASVEELSEVDGIPKNIAQKIYDYFLTKTT